MAYARIGRLPSVLFAVLVMLLESNFEIIGYRLSDLIQLSESAGIEKVIAPLVRQDEIDLVCMP